MLRNVSRWRTFFLLLVIGLSCLLSVRSLRVFPNFSATDEAIIFDYVDTLKQTGSIEPRLNPYRSPILNGNLYIYAAAAWTELFPGDPFSLRYLSALGGFVLLAVVYGVARQFGSGTTALTATALMAINLLWTAVSHIGRQDIWLAVFVWLAVGLALAGQKRHSHRLALLAGLVVALSADVHPFGVLACLALGGWWLMRWYQQAVSPTLLRSFVIGGLVGAAYYAVVHILPDPAAFAAAVQRELFSNGAEGGSALAAMVQRHVNYFASNPLEIGLLIFCAFKAARDRHAQSIGIFVIILVGLYAALVADPNPYYPIVWFTGLVILSAMTISKLSNRWRVPLALTFFAAFIINNARIERHVDARWNLRVIEAIEEVAAQAPASGSGLGETFFYMALRGQFPQGLNFFGFTYVYFQALETRQSYWDVIVPLAPGWIVTMDDDRAFAPPYDTLSVEVPHMRLILPENALESGYRLSDSIPTSVGTFEIWQRR